MKPVNYVTPVHYEPYKHMLVHRVQLCFDDPRIAIHK